MTEKEPIHLVLIEAHYLEKILRASRRRKKAGTIMLITGGWMIVLSAFRGRKRDNGSWDRATK